MGRFCRILTIIWARSQEAKNGQQRGKSYLMAMRQNFSISYYSFCRPFNYLNASKMIMRPEPVTEEHLDPCPGQTDCRYDEGSLRESESVPENASLHP